MDIDSTETEELFRIITKAQVSYSADVVCRARRELVRRLGGTRKAALKRMRRRGVFILVAAVLLALTSAIPFLHGESDPLFWVALALGLVLALGIGWLGLALVRGSEWIYRRIPLLVSSADRRVLTDDPPLEDLLPVAGEERARHPEEEVAEAESVLLERICQAREQHKGRIRTWGAWAIGLGLPVILHGAGLSLSMGVGAGSPDDIFPGMMRWRFVAVGFLNLFFGAGLFVGGLGLRRLADRARRLLIYVLWGYLVCGCILGLVFVGLMAEPPAAMGGGMLLFQLCALPLNIAISVWIVVSLTRPLKRPETLEAIDPSLLKQRDQTGGRLTVAKVTICVGLVVVLVPTVLCALWWQNTVGELQEELRSLEKAGARLHLVDWKPPVPPADQNGAELVRRVHAALERAEEQMDEAGLAVPPSGELDSWKGLISVDRWSAEQKSYAEKAIDCLQPALNLAGRAADRPHVNFDWNYSLGLDMPTEELLYLRETLRLVLFSSRIRAARGDYDLCRKDLKRAFHLCRFPPDPSMLVFVIRTAVLSESVNCCEPILRDASAPVLLRPDLAGGIRKAVDSLDLAETQRYERAFAIWVWERLKRGHWKVLEKEDVSEVRALIARPVLAPAMTTLLRVDTGAIQAAQKPFPERLEATENVRLSLEAMAGEVAPVHFWRGSIPDPLRLFSGVHQGARDQARVQAEVRCLLAAAAFRRYWRDNGRRAAGFEELVPDYLPEVPRDPFTGNELHVRREGGYLLVYSVGENREDDEGQVRPGEKCDEPPDVGVRVAE